MFPSPAAWLGRSAWLRKTMLGTPLLRDVTGHFVGGNDLDEGLATVHTLGTRGIHGSLNYYGAHVQSVALAEQAAVQAETALLAIHDSGLDADVSIKLTKLGLDVDPQLCGRLLHRVLDRAKETGGFVWIDMEESRYTDETLRLHAQALRRYGPDHVGLALQSYLRGREADLDRVAELGGRVRLVKGGCRETPAVAWQSKADVDAAFHRDITRLLRRGARPAIATHDTRSIDWTRQNLERLGLPRDAVEFQMLQGVKPELQASLSAEGFPVRAYVIYGAGWPLHVLSNVRQLLRPGHGPSGQE